MDNRRFLAHDPDLEYIFEFNPTTSLHSKLWLLHSDDAEIVKLLCLVFLRFSLKTLPAKALFFDAQLSQFGNEYHIDKHKIALIIREYETHLGKEFTLDRKPSLEGIQDLLRKKSKVRKAYYTAIINAYEKALLHENLTSDWIKSSLFKNHKNFIPANDVKIVADPQSTHQKFSLLKEVSSPFSVWVVKHFNSVDTEQSVFNELLAAEMHRFMLDDPYGQRKHPFQPKTQLINLENQESALLSEMIPNFKPLNFINRRAFLEWAHAYKIVGIAAASVLTLLTGDRDRNSRNLGVNADHRMISFDFDKSFHIPIRPITTQLIDDLPFRNEGPLYAGENYFRLYRKGVRRESLSFLDQKLASVPQVRREKYQTIMRLAALTDELYVHFITLYSSHPDVIQAYSDFFIRNRDKIFTNALQLKSFRDYLLSEEARLDLKEHVRKGFQFFQATSGGSVLGLFGTATHHRNLTAISNRYLDLVETAKVVNKKVDDAKACPKAS